MKAWQVTLLVLGILFLLILLPIILIIVFINSKFEDIESLGCCGHGSGKYNYSCKSQSEDTCSANEGLYFDNGNCQECVQYYKDM